MRRVAPASIPADELTEIGTALGIEAQNVAADRRCELPHGNIQQSVGTYYEATGMKFLGQSGRDKISQKLTRFRIIL